MQAEIDKRLRAEKRISVSNLEEKINEHLLWRLRLTCVASSFVSPRHGTSKDAAEKIARTDFYVPVGKDMKHAARFGNGAYLAEDVEKSWRGRNGPERALDRLFRTISVAKLYQNRQVRVFDSFRSIWPLQGTAAGPSHVLPRCS